MWDQPRGYVTDPINVGNGFLILKVEEHQKAGLASFEEVLKRDHQQAVQSALHSRSCAVILPQLRVNAFLEIKPGYEDSGAAPGKNTAWVDPAEIKPETVTKEQVARSAAQAPLAGPGAHPRHHHAEYRHLVVALSGATRSGQEQ